MDTFLAHPITVAEEMGGVTASIRAQTVIPPQDVWYVPRNPDIALRVDKEESVLSLATFVNTHNDTLMFSDALLGIWINPETHKYCFDIIDSKQTLSEARQDAEKINEGTEEKIVAIYNPLKKETVYL